MSKNCLRCRARDLPPRRPSRPLAPPTFWGPCRELGLQNSDSYSFFGEQRFSAFAAVLPHSLQIYFGSLTNGFSLVSLMLPGQQVIAHNLVSWEPVCVCLAIFVSDCLHGELFVSRLSYQRRIRQSRNLAPPNYSLCGGELKVGKSILVINLAFALAAPGNQPGYPLKSLLPRPARNNGSSTTVACTTPCI